MVDVSVCVAVESPLVSVWHLDGETPRAVHDATTAELAAKELPLLEHDDPAQRNSLLVHHDAGHDGLARGRVLDRARAWKQPEVLEIRAAGQEWHQDQADKNLNRRARHSRHAYLCRSDLQPHIRPGHRRENHWGGRRATARPCCR